jgi:hypothetical protein
VSYIGELSPETRRVIAAALAFRKKHGHDLMLHGLHQLVREENASWGAVLVATLGLGPGPGGQPVKLSDRDARVYVGDADTRVALLQYGRRRVRADVEGPFRPW